MSPRKLLTQCPYQGFPRVSGDEPFPFTLDDGTKMFSPRERG